MGKGEKPILSVRIDAEVLRRVDALADQAGVGRAEIVERCLSLGLANQEGLVEWVQQPIKGPLVQLLTHPGLLRAFAKLIGDEMELDETSVKLRAQAVRRRKNKGRAKPAME